MRAVVSGSRLLPLGFQPKVLRTEKVASEGTPGVFWTVTWHADGSVTCDCPDFRIRRQPLGEECKHISQF